jgi:hypothetical protein
MSENQSKNKSKVIHVSDEVHSCAKRFCHEHNFRMNEWVSSLILKAVGHDDGIERCRPVRKKRKIAEDLQHCIAPNPDDAPPPYALPPFWAQQANGH